MKTKEKAYGRSKLGQLLDERNLSLKEFAALVYDKTGYFIAITNLSNYCTGLRRPTNIRILKHFADTLEVPITDVI